MLGSLVLVFAMLSLSVGRPVTCGAQESTAKITVQIVEQEGSRLTGLALLEAAESGTSVQVVVLGARAGMVAVIRRGTCDPYDELPEASLGDVGAAGQSRVVVPTPFATVAPTQEPACASVAEWIDAVARFGAALAAIFQPIYEGCQRAIRVHAANGLRAAAPAVEDLLIRSQQIPVPALAAEIHAQIVANLQLLVEGLYQWLSGFETANQSDYFTGTPKVSEAEQKMVDECGVHLPTATDGR